MYQVRGFDGTIVKPPTKFSQVLNIGSVTHPTHVIKSTRRSKEVCKHRHKRIKIPKSASIRNQLYFSSYKKERLQTELEIKQRTSQLRTKTLLTTIITKAAEEKNIQRVILQSL
jgi:hypothetical protein